jgi:hypothetical protein
VSGKGKVFSGVVIVCAVSSSGDRINCCSEHEVRNNNKQIDANTKTNMFLDFGRFMSFSPIIKKWTSKINFYFLIFTKN